MSTLRSDHRITRANRTHNIQEHEQLVPAVGGLTWSKVVKDDALPETPILSMGQIYSIAIDRPHHFGKLPGTIFALSQTRPICTGRPSKARQSTSSCLSSGKARRLGSTFTSQLVLIWWVHYSYCFDRELRLALPKTSCLLNGCFLELLAFQFSPDCGNQIA